MAVCPPLVVDIGPPPPRRFGLLSSGAAMLHPDDPRVGCGVEYHALCGTSHEWFEPCPDDESPAESPGESPGCCAGCDQDSPGDGEKIPSSPSLVSGDPFPVYVLWQCPAVGLSEQQAVRNATDLLALTEERTVERHLWCRFLDDPASNCQTVANNCDDVCFAVANVEAAIAGSCPGQGVLHVPLVLATYLADGNMLVRNGNRLETPYGTPIVLGSGYTVNPDGNTAYIVGTCGVHVWRTPTTTIPTFDTRANVRDVLAERQYVVTYDCACAAALVTICEPA